ncbi:exosome complex component MTR3-like [Uloborus diversus]|uniref:exosome complex component MTR3-like n=1 Tax=Uloborus diversus TaxID=327109 RepID=UPI0024095BAA|nr:exosome complex component MTR3-like [Uloborus diversus]
MGKDNRRISAPDNCLSPLNFKECNKKELTDIDSRPDGRACDELKPISLKVGIAPGVTGSAYLECGKTKVICSVNGPRDVLHKSDSAAKGQLLCEFKFATFSCKERQPYLPSEEESNISKSIQDALEPVILLHKFPKSRLDISIIVLENDGGAISAAVTCAGAALSNAGVEIYDLPVGCNLVCSKDIDLLDPTYEEETSYQLQNYAKLTIAMMPAYNSQIILMDSFGNLSPVLLSKVHNPIL